MKKVKPEDIEASLVQIMDKRIALERMYGSMKYDTKKDIEEFLGNLWTVTVFLVKIKVKKNHLCHQKA